MTDTTKRQIDRIHNGQIPTGYRRTNAGIIPSNWESKPLSSIVEEITETPGSSKIETVSISAGIGFVNQAKKFGKELSGKQYEKYIVLHRGDFSYNKGNSSTYPQGCIYRLIDRKQAAVPNVFESFRICDGDANYYEQLFTSGFLNQQLSSKINRGVRDNGLLNLTSEEFYSCEVPFPPIEEQQKIAKILTLCDHIISLHRKQISEVKRQKDYFLQNMFPRQGEKCPRIRFPNYITPWEQRKLGDCVTITSGEAPSKFKNGSINYVKVDDLNSAYKTVVDTQNKVSDNQSVSKVKAGSVIFPKRGAAILTNKVRILGIESYMDTNMMALTTSSLDASFLYILILREGLYKIADTSTIPQINNKHIEPYDVILPTLVEQQRIGEFFAQLDNLITLHQQKLDAMKVMKKSLMQLLLTGIVRVNT